MSLEETLKERFRNMSTDALVRRIERAPDFGYDDEAIELTRRLDAESKAWRWKTDTKIEVF